VSVEIPQGWRRISGDFDLLIVDEAHDIGYGVPGGDIDKIRDKIGRHVPILLLTGTPSFLIGRENPLTVGNGLHAFSLEEMRKAEVDEGILRVSDLMTELALSSYGLKEDDYTDSGDIKDSAQRKFTNKSTKATLDSMLTGLVKRVQAGPHATGWKKKIAASESWSDALTALKKTIIACDSVKMANQVHRYFRRKGVNALISHSQTNDIADRQHSENIRRFVNEPSVSLLVVADRAQLGFDFPELVNFIDLTCTKSPNRIFQMLCRVIRTPQTKRMEKLFIKSLPRVYDEYEFMAFMTGVFELERTHWFTTWNGRTSTLKRLTVVLPPPGNGGCEGPQGPGPGIDTSGGGSTGGSGGGGEGPGGSAGGTGGGAGGAGGKVQSLKRYRPLLLASMQQFGNAFDRIDSGDDAYGGFACKRLGEVLGVRVNDSEGTKRKILAALLAGEFSRKHPLYWSHVGYSNPNKPNYDPVYVAAAEKAGWRCKFLVDPDGKKSYALMEAKRLGYRPSALTRATTSYTSPETKTFDKAFTDAYKAYPIQKTYLTQQRILKQLTDLGHFPKSSGPENPLYQHTIRQARNSTKFAESVRALNLPSASLAGGRVYVSSLSRAAKVRALGYGKKA
jgi:uncharacterized membrane protein YgcG